VIKTKTVFVVGAGGSVPYGMPTAAELNNRLHVHVKPSPPDPLHTLKETSNPPDRNAVVEFLRRYNASHCYTIDRFLEQQPDEPTRRIGKLLIAAALAPNLRSVEAANCAPRNLPGADRKKGRTDEDWLKYLFNFMISRTGSPAEFIAGNDVHFVTFNFDPILEVRLSGFAEALWQDEQGLVGEWLQKRVCHVHGTIDVSAGDLYSIEWLEREARKIRIVHEKGDRAVLERAITWLKQAEVICFLGFSFDPANLAKLTIPAIAKGRPLVFASTLGMSTSEVWRAKNSLHPDAKTHNGDCLETLKELPILRD
jgi:hypothetical protein